MSIGTGVGLTTPAVVVVGATVVVGAVVVAGGKAEAEAAWT
jgi:hypothetical protein